MVRFFGILIGLFFAGMLIYSFGRGAVEYVSFMKNPRTYLSQVTAHSGNLTINSFNVVFRSIRRSVQLATVFVWLLSVTLQNWVTTKMR